MDRPAASDVTGNTSMAKVLGVGGVFFKSPDPADKQYMFNLVVDDLEGALRQVEQGGAELIGEVESYDFGSFGWFVDPDGNKVELWEPRIPERDDKNE